MKTIDDFKVAAQCIADNHNSSLIMFRLNPCFICGTSLHYLIWPAIDRILLARNCKCVTYGIALEERNFQDLADYYNRQTNADYIAEMNEFWGFKEEK